MCVAIGLVHGVHESCALSHLSASKLSEIALQPFEVGLNVLNLGLSLYLLCLFVVLEKRA